MTTTTGNVNIYIKTCLTNAGFCHFFSPINKAQVEIALYNIFPLTLLFLDLSCILYTCVRNFWVDKIFYVFVSLSKAAFIW